MCDQHSLRSAYAYAQSDQSLCLSLEYSMTVKLLSKHNLEIISLKGGCAGASESTLVKIPHCWKSHVAARICIGICTVCFTYVTHEHYFLYANINQKKCNLAVLLVISHVLGQRWIQKISYRGV